MAASDDRVIKLEQGESSGMQRREIESEMEEEDSPPAGDSHVIEIEQLDGSCGTGNSKIQSESLQVSDPAAQEEHKVVVELEKYMNIRLIEHSYSNMYYFTTIDGSTKPRPTICMVPSSIRKGNENAYTPKLISIGPFHRGEWSAELRQTEPLKWRYLQDLIQRSPKKNSLRRYISVVREKVGEARKHYLGDVGHISDDKDLVEMLVLDGCFLLEFLFKRAEGPVGYHWSDFRWNLTFLRHDLLLLENQIPFLILQLLFDKTHNVPQPADEKFTPLTLMDFVLHYLFKKRRADKIKIPENKQVHHLLHLYHLGEVELLNSIRNQANQGMMDRLYYLKRPLKLAWKWISPGIFFLASILLMCKIPKIKKEKDDKEEEEEKKETIKYPRAIPTARKLRDAGVKFKRKTQDKGQECFLDVSFNKEDGEIEMPLLSIQNTTVSSLRNLIAFEQCNVVTKTEQYFTSFAVFMDQVIDTSEDVAILCDDKVIESKLGCEEDVAKLFNGICSGVSLNYDKHYLKDLFKKVNDYSQLDRNRWRADLVRRYFHSPWAVISFFAAFLLLALTAVQTGYTIKQSYKP